MKKTLLVFSAVALLAVSCDGNTSNKSNASTEQTATQATTPTPASQGQQHTEYPDWQTNKGIGPVKTVQPRPLWQPEVRKFLISIAPLAIALKSV